MRYPKAVFPNEEKNTIPLDPSKLMEVKDMRAYMIQNRTTGPLSGKGIILPDSMMTDPSVKIVWNIVECDGITTLVAIKR